MGHFGVGRMRSDNYPKDQSLKTSSLDLRFFIIFAYVNFVFIHIHLCMKVFVLVKLRKKKPYV